MNLKEMGSEMFKPVETAVGGNGNRAVGIESVADILARELDHVIRDWLVRVEQEPDCPDPGHRALDARPQDQGV